ncbi:hypothetical protein [Rhodococcus sp. Q]|uniref:hypothetical protein n=1 Tax=Rhodococcus sp. Q TaxID=2502252 RepID=UPI0010F88DDB|nr:hypothetical protein [Rhodococcus sp. Q]
MDAAVDAGGEAWYRIVTVTIAGVRSARKRLSKLGTNVALMMEVVADGLLWEEVSALPVGTVVVASPSDPSKAIEIALRRDDFVADQQWLLAGSEAWHDTQDLFEGAHAIAALGAVG